MRREIIRSVVAVLALTLVCGLAYPLAMTGIAQVVFPGRADGSLVRHDGRVVGSRLQAQAFTLPGRGGRPDPRYFQPRPSQTSYSGSATSFPNRGPNQRAARRFYRAALRRYLALNRPSDPGLRADAVPVDAVTTSASGVDPHISAANARIQARRVAAVRRLPLARVMALVDAHTDGRALGVFGEPGVNVLELNLALDRSAR
ncbi:MAG TPA: K(+)-transporting ATPase subunit C [Solirubrobacteraceae bacterium]|nr:K(+)-transporting ATPase subunit C [Solirubrobacteraceae bacterium]